MGKPITTGQILTLATLGVIAFLIWDNSQKKKNAEQEALKKKVDTVLIDVADMGAISKQESTTLNAVGEEKKAEPTEQEKRDEEMLKHQQAVLKSAVKFIYDKLHVTEDMMRKQGKNDTFIIKMATQNGWDGQLLKEE